MGLNIATILNLYDFQITLDTEQGHTFLFTNILYICLFFRVKGSVIVS